MIFNKKEHPERYGWWISELDSLGVTRKMKRNNIKKKDRKEISDLTENIKQALYSEYKNVYDSE